MTTLTEVPAGRAAKITELLERIHELSEPGATNEGIGGANADRLLLLPHDPRCGLLTDRCRCDCWQRCITHLQALIYELQFDNWTLWRQLRLRYLQCEHVTVDAQYRAGSWRIVDTETRRWRGLALTEQVLAMSGGWTLALADARQKKTEAWQDARLKLARWSDDVSPGLVRLGVNRLAETWSQPFEPYTPVVKIAA